MRWTRRFPPWAGRIAGWRLVRLLVWLVLIGETYLLVRAEAHRPSLPEGVAARKDLAYRHDGGRTVRLDVYLPASQKRPQAGWPAVVAIHGGGWRGGGKRQYGQTVAPLARYGLALFVIDYQLSRPGEPSWSKNLDDAREAVRWVRRHANDFGVDPQKIAVLGASAGGHLAALLGTLQGRSLEAPGQAPDNAARVQAVIDFYGPADLTRMYTDGSPARPSMELMLGGTPSDVPERYRQSSPRNWVTSQTAPMLLIHGRNDALVPLSQSETLAQTLQNVGVMQRLVVVDRARHGFGLQPEGHDLALEIVDFLQDVWSVRQSSSVVELAHRRSRPNPTNVGQPRPKP